MTRRTIHIRSTHPKVEIAIATYSDSHELLDWREYNPTFASQTRLARVIENEGQLDNAFDCGLAMFDQD